MRTVHHIASGAVKFRVRGQGGLASVTVHTDPSIPIAYAEITAVDLQEEKARDLVEKVTFGSRGDEFWLTVPHDESAGGSGGNVTVSGNTIYGRSFSSVSISGGGQVVVSGRVINGGNAGGHSGIKIAVFLPERSDLDFDFMATDITTTGRLIDVRGKNMSGDITIDTADDVRVLSQSGNLEVRTALSVRFSGQSSDAEVSEVRTATIKTMSGNVDIGELTESAHLESMSGNVSVSSTKGARAAASTMSGNVTFRGNVQGDPSTMTGNIRRR